MSFLKDAISKKPPEAAPAASSLDLPDRYQGMLDANPYRNQPYQSTPWQNFLSFLGFRTQADAWKENMSVQAAEYDAAIAQKAYDESYETPSAQAARMRAAGLNPDLNGGEGINPGEAASLPQDPSTPMQSTGAEGSLPEFANLIMEGFSTAIGFVQAFQGINANHLSNTLKAFQNEEAFQGFVRSMVPQLTPDSPEDQVLDNGEIQSWRYRASMMANMFAKKNLPRRFRDKFISSIEQYWNSAPAKPELWKQWLEGLKGEKGYEEEFNSFYSDDRRIMRSIWKRLGEAQEKIRILKMGAEGQEASTAMAEGELREEIAQNTDGKVIGEARTSEAQLQKDIADYTDGEAIGKAKTSTAQVEDINAQIQKILRQCVRDILKDAENCNSILGDAFVGSINLLQFLKGFDLL